MLGYDFLNVGDNQLANNDGLLLTLTRSMRNRNGNTAAGKKQSESKTPQRKQTERKHTTDGRTHGPTDASIIKIWKNACINGSDASGKIFLEI